MKNCAVVVILMSVLVSGVSTPVPGGECIDSDEAYVAALEAGPPGHLFNYAVYCLGDNPIIDGRHWAGPRAAAEFAAVRSDSLRRRLERVLPRLLASTWADSADNHHRIFRIAARHGIASIDSQDVYSRLLVPEQSPYFNVYEDLAILQDCRSVDFLEERYRELRQNRPEKYPDEIDDLLSCLYHIPCDQALVQARRLYAQEQDQKLRERLGRVLNRK